jgi:hypothetical protein
MALNDKSTAHLLQYAELELLFVNNPDAVAFNAEFGARRVKYGEGMVECYRLRDAANASTAGFTKAKKLAKKVSSKSASAITSKGISYAIKIEDVELEGQMTKWSNSFLYNSNDPDFAGVIQNIYTTLSAFVVSDPTGTLHFFTALQLDAMQEDKLSFTGKLNLYKNALSAINTAKGNFTVTQIPVMDAHIKFLEGFLTDIAVDFADFVTEFKTIVKKLSVIGKRNQGASAAMTYAATGNPVVLVGQLRITNYPAVKVPKIINTNSMGIIDLLQLKIGVWDGVFSAPDCQDQEVTVTVKTKKIVHFEIAMKAI